MLSAAAVEVDALRTGGIGGRVHRGKVKEGHIRFVRGVEGKFKATQFARPLRGVLAVAHQQ